MSSGYLKLALHCRGETFLLILNCESSHQSPCSLLPYAACPGFQTIKPVVATRMATVATEEASAQGERTSVTSSSDSKSVSSARRCACNRVRLAGRPPSPPISKATKKSTSEAATQACWKVERLSIATIQMPVASVTKAPIPTSNIPHLPSPSKSAISDGLRRVRAAHCPTRPTAAPE